MQLLTLEQIIAQRQFLTNEHGHFTGRLLVSPPQNATPPETWTITASLSTRDAPDFCSRGSYIHSRTWSQFDFRYR